MDLGWESLQSRRNTHKFLLFYKILHGIAPNNLSELVPPLVQETTTYSLRNSDNIRNYRVRTNLFLKFFFPSTIRAWNNLQSEIKSAFSVASFKHGIKRNITCPQSTTILTSTRKGQVLHARLRLECNSLNADLYWKQSFLPMWTF